MDFEVIAKAEASTNIRVGKELGHSVTEVLKCFTAPLRLQNEHGEEKLYSEAPIHWMPVHLWEYHNEIYT